MADSHDVALSWVRHDPEQRIGFRGGRHTRVNNLLSFLIGGLLTIGFYVVLIPFNGTRLAAMFTQRGATPYLIVMFSCWSLTILFLKSRKLAFQRRALQQHVVPESHEFVLSSTTVDQVIQRIYQAVDDPKHFLLFNRIVVALSNLRNLGRVADVDDILCSQAEHEESAMETSYSVVQGFVWAIPVLGFIGTVVGLSSAIGGFGDVLSSANELSELSAALRVVTSGLNTAFETTLEALVAALVIHLLLTFLKKSEEEFMDECSDYCVRNIVGKLRVMPYEEAEV